MPEINISIKIIYHTKVVYHHWRKGIGLYNKGNELYHLIITNPLINVEEYLEYPDPEIYCRLCVTGHKELFEAKEDLANVLLKRLRELDDDVEFIEGENGLM